MMMQEAIDVNVFVRNILDALSPVVPNALTTSLARKEITVVLDPTRMGEGLKALISDDCQALSGGSVVVIETRFLPITDTEAACDETGCALLSISFSPKPGGHTHRERLRFMYGVVKQHRGSMRVSRDQLNGERVSIYLPCRRPADNHHVWLHYDRQTKSESRPHL
jgi:hypothetical protein